AVAEIPGEAPKHAPELLPDFTPDRAPGKHAGHGNHAGPVPEFERAEGDTDLFPPGAAGDPVDPATPLDGRLYIGMGLISFPYEEQDTGKVRTMLMVRPGDDVKVSTVTAGRPPAAVHFNATVVDIFKSGMSEYDSNLVFCN